MTNATEAQFPFRHSRLLDLWPGRPLRKPYFISHAYADRAGLGSLKAALPQRINPVVFPPIDVNPRQTVSAALIQRIRECYGLIYVDSPASKKSFWVNFEMRTAGRLGRNVAAYDPNENNFTVKCSSPTNTTAVLWNSELEQDDRLGLEIAQWLREKRNVAAGRALKDLGHAHFTFDRYSGTYSPDGNIPVLYGETQSSLRRKMLAKACVILLLSNAACSAPWPFDDRDYLAAYGKTGDLRGTGLEVAWLEPPNWGAIQSGFQEISGQPQNKLFRDLVLSQAQSPDELVLTQNGQINWPRVDDLLMRLEHTAFENGTLGIDLRDAMSSELRDIERFEQTAEQSLRRTRINYHQDKYL